MDSDKSRPGKRGAKAGRSVTIKDLAAALGLSITTISRALNGYSDVGEKTRERVSEMAKQLGYRPNRNAQRLVTQRTHNLAWVQPDNERKFLDPHFVEVMAGVLRGARAAHYDIVLSSDTPNRELAAYDRYVRDNSVDGFILDLPREGDARIGYLLDAGRPFVVHGRESRHPQYGWVDVDNYGNFYQLTRLLIANGHRRIAFINGDENFNYARYRSIAARDAVADAGLPPEALAIHNSLHPMGDAGYQLTARALEDSTITAILYSSSLMTVEGYAAIQQLGEQRQVAMASMDDGLHYLDLGRVADHVSFARSSLRDAGIALIDELVRQCEGGAPSGHQVPSHFHVAPGLDAGVLDEPLPLHRR